MKVRTFFFCWKKETFSGVTFRKKLFQSLGNVTQLTGERVQMLGSEWCMDFEQGSVWSCHVCCDTDPRFYRSRPRGHFVQSHWTLRRRYWEPILTESIQMKSDRSQARSCLYASTRVRRHHFPLGLCPTPDWGLNYDPLPYFAYIISRLPRPLGVQIMLYPFNVGHFMRDHSTFSQFNC